MKILKVLMINLLIIFEEKPSILFVLLDFGLIQLDLLKLLVNYLIFLCNHIYLRDDKI